MRHYQHRVPKQLPVVWHPTDELLYQFEYLDMPWDKHDLEFKPQTKPNKNNQVLVAFYPTSRAVQSRLDAVFGKDLWNIDYIPVTIGKYTGFLAKLTATFNNGNTVTKVDGADLTDIEAFKGGISSAQKRVMTQFGSTRYLYDVDTVWAEHDGRRFTNENEIYAKLKPENFPVEVPDLIKLCEAFNHDYDFLNRVATRVSQGRVHFIDFINQKEMKTIRSSYQQLLDEQKNGRKTN